MIMVAIFRYEYNVQVITQDRDGAEVEGDDWILYE